MLLSMLKSFLDKFAIENEIFFFLSEDKNILRND